MRKDQNPKENEVRYIPWVDHHELIGDDHLLDS
jgi:hypothetical protein